MGCVSAKAGSSSSDANVGLAGGGTSAHTATGPATKPADGGQLPPVVTLINIKEDQSAAVPIIVRKNSITGDIRGQIVVSSLSRSQEVSTGTPTCSGSGGGESASNILGGSKTPGGTTTASTTRSRQQHPAASLAAAADYFSGQAESNLARNKLKEKTKDAEDLALVREALRGNSVISTLQDKEVEKILAAVEFYHFAAGETVCQQGAQGSYFFVVHEGEFEVSVSGKLVNVLRRGNSFGEIALIHNCPRSASVTASLKNKTSENSGCYLWGIPNFEFRRILRQISQSQYEENMRLLNRVPFFEILLGQQKNLVCDGVQVTIFQPGSEVCRKNEANDSLYVLKSGEVEASNGQKFFAGDFWGADALLSDSVAHAFDAKVVSSVPAVCIEVNRNRIELLDFTTNQHVLSAQSTGASSAQHNITSTTSTGGGGAGASTAGGGGVTNTTSVGGASTNTSGINKFSTALQELHFLHVMEKALNELDIFSGVNRAQVRSLLSHVTVTTLPPEDRDVLVPGSGSEVSAVVDRKISTGRTPKGFPDGTRFFVLLLGEAEVSTEQDSGGPFRMQAGEAYGGSLLVNVEQKFSARIRNVAVGNTIVASFAPDAFSELQLGDADMNNRLQTLKKVTIFRYLSDAQTLLLARGFRELPPLKENEVVFAQGDVGDRFFIIKNGEVRAELTIAGGGEEAKPKVLRTMGKSDYFGERALMFEEPRSASIIVNQPGTVLYSLDKDAFLRVMSKDSLMLKHLEYRIQLQNTFLSKDSLKVDRCVGRGTFGTVKLVHNEKTQVRYALKCVRKMVVQEKKQETSIRMEREILAENDHPFIVHLVKTFRDSKFLYFLTELVTGGELYDAIRELDLLSRTQAQFYLGSICLAVDYLHEKNIAYRDLKPENVLLDSQGYIKLIDFGCARKLGESGKTFTLIGTPHYMAPEIVLGRGYCQSVDIWSMGVCLYEFLCGPLPFGNDAGDDQLIVFKEILTGRLHFPDYVEDVEAMDLIKRLLCRTPELRIGCSLRGIWDIREHAFFSGFSFDLLLGRQLPAPLVPQEEVYTAESLDLPEDDYSKDPDIEFSWEKIFAQ
ncbi:unnamed protein product [Amoebophrya sp. A25]|nr:unnamed protein product [Amoebophrya sp. A25]|eukprot:GSA25T00005562001.1